MSWRPAIAIPPKARSFRAISSPGLSCRYNGVEIFRADLFPAFSANPFITFFTIAQESGKFDFEWTGDKGFNDTASASIIVE